jgi:hypothetical protein
MAQGLRGRGLTFQGAPRAAQVAALAVVLAGGTGCFPQLSVVEGRIFGNWVELDAASSQEFGRAQSPGYGLQVDIAKHDWDAPARVGRLVHDALFPDEPDFSFNVEFARGDGDSYTDPTSIWFNAFMGYYEIKVPKETWHRPFGYRFEEGRARIAPDDLLRIGRADWNYFSAYLYGVPFSVVDASARQGGMLYHLGRTEGLRSWDLVELDGIEVVSAYVSGQDGQSLAQNACLYTDLWRRFLGPPHPPLPSFPSSFPPTRMRSRLYLTYWEDHSDRHRPVYTTLVFGGTVSEAYPDREKAERFLDAQVRSVAAIVARRFPWVYPPRPAPSGR